MFHHRRRHFFMWHLYYSGLYVVLSTVIRYYFRMSPKFIDVDPQKLRAARHRKALTLRELGEKVGMDHNLIWMYEAGRRNPIPRNLRRLAEALDVEPVGLMREP